MLKDLLNEEKDFEVIGEAADGLEAVQLVSLLQPDALVTDLMMPRLHGFEVISQLRLNYPKTRIVVVSVQKDKPYVLEVFRRGSNGFVQKESIGVHLVNALRCVFAGGRYLSPPCDHGWLMEIQPDRAWGSLDLAETLTDQQRRILALIAAGSPDLEIAEQLRLKPVMVAHIRSFLIKKFKLGSQAELIRFVEKNCLSNESGPA